MLKLNLLPKAFLAFLMLAALPALADEVHVSVGGAKVSSLGGCCKSEGTKFNIAVGMSLEQIWNYSLVEIEAKTSGKWSAVSLGPAWYLYGGRGSEDPATAEGVSAIAIPKWSMILSTGLGMVFHQSRTKNFDLPIFVVGTSVYLRPHFIYAIERNLALDLSFEASLAFSKNYFTAAIVALTGLRYRF
jgi:hypothetical protein